MHGKHVHFAAIIPHLGDHPLGFCIHTWHLYFISCDFYDKNTSRKNPLVKLRLVSTKEPLSKMQQLVIPEVAICCVTENTDCVVEDIYFHAAV